MDVDESTGTGMDTSDQQPQQLSAPSSSVPATEPELVTHADYNDPLFQEDTSNINPSTTREPLLNAPTEEKDELPYNGQSLQYNSARRGSHRNGRNNYGNINRGDRRQRNYPAVDPPTENIRYINRGIRQTAELATYQEFNPYIGFHNKTPREHYRRHMDNIDIAVARAAGDINTTTDPTEREIKLAQKQVLCNTFTFLDRLRTNHENADTDKFCSFPVPMDTVLSPHYFQSWRFDRFSRSPWICYQGDDGKWLYEHRTGFVYRYINNGQRQGFEQVEQYPKYFNPYRYFTVDAPFMPGEINWDGAFTDEIRADKIKSLREYDAQLAATAAVPAYNQKLPVVEMPDMPVGLNINRDVASIMTALGIRGYATHDIKPQSSTTVRDKDSQIQDLRQQIDQLRNQMDRMRDADQRTYRK
ncbi:uncharacterized protein LOC129601508 [Paramacrobiotus metropolitanus]|uniref:uncharacterized protein LOC129601508 n=1 Tax=Paramacrobiotus metropolitanus TaxID=2943436 RepID=UPI002445EB60|nr:uncharacterized protein LOC129601508 [Paramacrobiotus metropolitanus]